MEIRKNAVDLTDLAVGITILGIVVAIGATILVNIRNNAVTELSTYSVVNESVSPTDSGVQFAEGWFSGLTTCNNATSGEVINSANYTVSINSENGVGTIVNLTDTFPNPWKCTYSVYNTSEAQYDLPNKAAIGLGEYGNWFDIIVIVGVAAVVLSLIFLAFGRREQAGSVGY